MVEERFSYLVEEYFTKKGTIPVVFSYKPFNCPDLDDLQDEIFHYFNSIENIDVEITRKLDDEFWPGVLIELSEDSPVSDYHSQIYKFYNNLVPQSNNSITGLSIGHNAYCSANLEYLGKNYFKSQGLRYSP